MQNVSNTVLFTKSVSSGKVLYTTAVQLATSGHICEYTLCVYIYIYIYIYTACPRRNVPDFGRVFLMLNYTDITQNTYVQS